MTKPAQYEATLIKHPRIHGVKTKPLRLIPDERGWLLEILRADDTELFTKFGQVYVSATYPGVVKAWHYHRKQVDNFACVSGMLKLVLVDTRVGSVTEGVVNEFFIGTHNPTLMRMLRKALDTIPVKETSEVGLDVDAKEAIAFAVMAYETAHARPSNVPFATGARRSVVLGKLTQNGPARNGGVNGGPVANGQVRNGSVVSTHKPKATRTAKASVAAVGAGAKAAAR